MTTKMTLDGIIEDLQAIEPQLLAFEKKYKLLSSYFYKLYLNGKLECEDEFQEWAALYEAKLHREQLFSNYLTEALSNLPLSHSVSAEELT